MSLTHNKEKQNSTVKRTWSRGSCEDDGAKDGVDDDGNVEPHLSCHKLSISRNYQKP